MKIYEKISAHNADPWNTAPVTMAFLGDSVTHGCFEVYETPQGIDCIYDYENVYHNQLKRRMNTLFPRATLNIIDAGISGSNAAHGLSRLERDVLRFSPDFVCVSFGLNDSCGGMKALPDYIKALEGIFSKLKENGTETVFLSQNMMCSYVRKDIPKRLAEIAADVVPVQVEGTLSAFFDAAAKACAEYGVTYCDAYGRWAELATSGVDTTMLLANGINHPSREMHGLFADVLMDAIRK